MPINSYFKGRGKEVMSSMKKTYGDKKAKNVFYALANKKGENPGKAELARKGKKHK